MAPAIADLTRLLASLRLAGGALRLDAPETAELSEGLLVAYCDALALGKARWVERATARGMVRDLLVGARARSSRALLDRRTVVEDGRRRLLIDGLRAEALAPRERTAVTQHLAEFVESVAKTEDQARFYRLIDVAARIAGTGSLGGSPICRPRSRPRAARTRAFCWTSSRPAARRWPRMSECRSRRGNQKLTGWSRSSGACRRSRLPCSPRSSFGRSSVCAARAPAGGRQARAGALERQAVAPEKGGGDDGRDARMGAAPVRVARGRLGDRRADRIRPVARLARRGAGVCATLRWQDGAILARVQTIAARRRMTRNGPRAEANASALDSRTRNVNSGSSSVRLTVQTCPGGAPSPDTLRPFGSCVSVPVT